MFNYLSLQLSSYSLLPPLYPLCGIVMGLMLITVPGSLLCRPAVRQELSSVLETRGCKVVHAFDDWKMHPCSLYLCIQAALCCPHSQWQEIKLEEKCQIKTTVPTIWYMKSAAQPSTFIHVPFAWKIFAGIWFTILCVFPFFMVHSYIKLLSIYVMITWVFIEQSKDTCDTLLSQLFLMHKWHQGFRCQR